MIRLKPLDRRIKKSQMNICRKNLRMEGRLLSTSRNSNSSRRRLMISRNTQMIKSKDMRKELHRSSRISNKKYKKHIWRQIKVRSSRSWNMSKRESSSKNKKLNSRSRWLKSQRKKLFYRKRSPTLSPRERKLRWSMIANWLT